MTVLTRAILLSTLVIPLHALAQTNSIHPYTTCKFDDGLTFTDSSPLLSNVAGRAVDTITGPRQVPILGGERITLSYPATDPFATMTVEQLPPATFEQGKADLIANFDFILSSGNDGTRNMAYALHPTLNGFEVHGLDRTELDGKILGVYLLIDDAAHTIATIDFLNQGPLLRKFSTLDEYAALRDHFLNAYTKCVHTPATTAKPPLKTAPARRPAKPARKPVPSHRKPKPRPHSQSTNTSAN